MLTDEALDVLEERLGVTSHAHFVGCTCVWCKCATAIRELREDRARLMHMLNTVIFGEKLSEKDTLWFAKQCDAARTAETPK